MDDSLINKFGYSEMYEWVNIPPANKKLGRFVQFDENEPEKIRIAIDDNEDEWEELKDDEEKTISDEIDNSVKEDFIEENK